MRFQNLVVKFSSPEKLSVDDLSWLGSQFGWLTPDAACKCLMIDCDKTWVSIQKTLEINDHKDHYFRLWVLFNIQGALVRKSVDEDLSFDPEAIPGHA